MDTKTLAHVSGELIAFAGLAVYFQRKSSALEERVRKLEADNNEIIDNLEHLNETTNGLYGILRGRAPTPVQSQAPAPAPAHTSVPAHVQSPVPVPVPSMLPISVPISAASTTVNLSNSTETEDERVLQEEMQRIQNERESTTSANVVCEDGVCTIVAE
jgi:hypothetical protein